MTIESWAIAALCAGALGWAGPYVIRLLPPSRDAEEGDPSYQEIAAVPRLSGWLALGAMVLVTIVALATPSHLLPAWTVVCGVGSWLAYTDARARLLPTRIVWPLFAVALVAVIAEAWLADNWGIAIRAAIASAVAFAVFWLFWWFGELWKAGGFGYGDVRLSAPLGLVLGSHGGWAVVVGLYLGLVAGAIVGMVLKSRGHNDAFALGPWLLLGAVLAPLVT